MVRCITDSPGPLPGEVIEALDADDTDPRVARVSTEHPGLDLSTAVWHDLLDAVLIPRAELEKVESPLRWEVHTHGLQSYVVAFFDSGVSLAASEPAPMFEGAYIASPTRGR